MVQSHLSPTKRCALPYSCSYGYGGPVLQCDGIFCATGPANTTAIAPPWIDYYLLIGSAVTNGAKLADTHALPTAVTKFRVNLGHVLCTEHYRHPVGYRAAHSKAI